MQLSAAAYIRHGVNIEGVTDSKKIKESERERIFEELKDLQAIGDADFFAVAVHHERIDEINIREATKEAMRDSVVGLMKKIRKKLKKSKSARLVDSSRLPKSLLGLPNQLYQCGESMQNSNP